MLVNIFTFNLNLLILLIPGKTTKQTNIIFALFWDFSHIVTLVVFPGKN